MKKFLTFLTLLICFNNSEALADANTNISAIRFGSTGDPLNGLTIAWKSLGTGDSIAWGYTTSMENGRFAGLKSTSIIGTQFEYTFPALTAGSTIHYTLFDSENGLWTEEKSYHTASDANSNKFSFTTLSDSRSYPIEWRNVSNAILDTDFTLFIGDIISDGSDAADWKEWFTYGEEFISRELIYHTVGNHDDDNSPSGFDNYLGLYTLPGNELYYSFNYGNAVFIYLNTESPSDTVQYNWLLSTLEANKDQTWKFLFFHKPFYTSPKHAGEMDAYFNTLWKAFDDYGVDMIFNGHTHNYQRTKPINRNISTTSPVASYGSGDGQGRCQIVTGSAGAPLYGVADPSLWWLDNSVNKRHFVHIDIDGDRLSMKAMDAKRVVFDSLIIDKINSDITFQVGLSEVTDLYDSGAVRLVFGDWDSSFVMTDTDGDENYTIKMTIPTGSDLKYFYSYQTGADPDTDFEKENVPAECGDEENYRVLKVLPGNLNLPSIYFGTCDKVPHDITFQVDLSEVSDLYNGGAVWLAFSTGDTSYLMTDTDVDSIYTLTLPFDAGTSLNYFFGYQNGSDPEANVVDESVPVGCSDDEGYRTLQVPDRKLTLPAVLFGSCFEASDIQLTPIISIPIISSMDDAEESDDDGSIDFGSSDLEIIFDNEPQHVGMLFREVYIPYGADIRDAYIQFTCDVPRTSTLPWIYIYGAAEVTVEAITGYPYSISSHPSTKAMVDWSPDPQLREGNATEAERTADISAIIEEIVTIDGWEARNNILIVIAGNSNHTIDINREVESYDGSATGAPTLNVTFEATFTPDITFQLDLNEVTDLFDAGAVWIAFNTGDTSYVMTDTDGDGIYSITLPGIAGTELEYIFAYQNGADPQANVFVETKPDKCANYEGYRVLKVPHRDFTLNAVSFGTCDVTSVMVSYITVTAAGSAAPAKAGDIIQMESTIIPEEATDKSVSWSVDDTSLATIDATTGLLTLAKNGVVTVTATANDVSGVTGTLDVKIIVSTSVFDLSNVNKVNLIYPNPTDGKLNIDNPNTDRFSFEIYSISGKLLFSRYNITEATTQVDMSGLSTGMYIVKVHAAERSEIHKVILR